MTATTVKYVLATCKPRMLHPTDCPHPPASPPPQWRLANPHELRTLARCYHCDRKDRGL
jgi:hypothetical protein